MYILKSRTFWTIVLLFIVSGVTAVKAFIPTSIQPVVDLVLSALAVYFHVNPSQSYGNSALNS